MNHGELTRRTFLGAALSLTTCRERASENPRGTALSSGAPPPPSPPGNSPSDRRASESKVGEIPKRPLGTTGIEVSMIGLGGAHLGKQDEAEAVRLMHSAIDRGVTFFDNCWDYNGGKSEERMGKALEGGRRQKVFLMTKLDGRKRNVAREQLEQSLHRLRTDVIDLVQIHEVIRPRDPDECFASGGCIEALVDAKKEGKIRFIGFTGHKDPEIHLAMLHAADRVGFRFDTVQMPLNVMDAHYRSFEKRVLPLLVSKRMGVLGMKALGSGDILDSKTVTARECLQYALNLPTSVVITGCDRMEILDQAVDVATKFRPLDVQEVATILERTRVASRQGAYEQFKTSSRFDGTDHHPHWLTTARL